jgi:GNAT superfamily N-acetyltransferase
VIPGFHYFCEDMELESTPSPALTIEALDREQASDLKHEIVKDPQPFVDTTGSEAVLRVSSLTCGLGNVFVAREDGVLVGPLSGDVTESGLAYTKGIAVHEQHRATGVGTLLTRAFADNAAANGASTIRAVARPLHWFRGESWQNEWTWMMFNLALGMSATLVPKFYAGEDRIVLSKALAP